MQHIKVDLWMPFRCLKGLGVGGKMSLRNKCMGLHSAQSKQVQMVTVRSFDRRGYLSNVLKVITQLL